MRKTTGLSPLLAAALKKGATEVVTVDLHYIVVLAQLVAEGRRRHPSNAAFGEWVKNDPEVLRRNRGPLTHQDRAALIKIAQLDPQEASAAIQRHGAFAGPERLWRDVLSYLAARKTTQAAPLRKTVEAVVRETAPEPRVRRSRPRRVSRPKRMATSLPHAE